MKLNYFSSQTVPQGYFGASNKKPRVAFGKAGTITFNEHAQKLLKLKEGDKLTLAQDEESPRDWYFFKDPEHGFELAKSSDKKYLKFGHSKLINEFYNAFGFEKGSKTFEFSETAMITKTSKTEFWQLIIHD